MTKDCGQDEIRQTEEELIKLELELQAHYCQMGKSILELADTEQKAIGRLVDEIIKCRKRLARRRQEIECPQCTAYNTADSIYCKRCGAMLQKTQEVNEHG